MKPPANDDILLYWSDELDPDERAAVEERLCRDPEAAAYLSELEELGEAFADVPKVTPQRTLARETVLQCQHPRPSSKVVGFPHWKPLAIAAALVIGIVTLGVQWAHKSTQTQQPITHDAPSTPSLDPSSPPSEAQAQDTSPKVSSRLFAKKGRFTSRSRFTNARERARKIRRSLPKDSI